MYRVTRQRPSLPVCHTETESFGALRGGGAFGDDYEVFPDIHKMFVYYNKLYFDGLLQAVSVEWSTSRMTLCAGVCHYMVRARKERTKADVYHAIHESRVLFFFFQVMHGYTLSFEQGRIGGCRIVLSEPILKFRPVSDLKNTLLHEMIHAFLFVTERNTDHDGHGPRFLAKGKQISASTAPDMYRPAGGEVLSRLSLENLGARLASDLIQSLFLASILKTGYKITVYHNFHDEVDLYRRHIWECNQCKRVIRVEILKLDYHEALYARTSRHSPFAYDDDDDVFFVSTESDEQGTLRKGLYELSKGRVQTETMQR